MNLKDAMSKSRQQLRSINQAEIKRKYVHKNIKLKTITANPAYIHIKYNISTGHLSVYSYFGGKYPTIALDI